MKTIQDEMFNMIESEINQTICEGKEKRVVNKDRAAKVAKVLVELCLEDKQEDSLSNDYIAQIKSICN